MVLKFGGSSLATLEHIENAASIIAGYFERGQRLIVVVSAMGDETNRLSALACEVVGEPHEAPYSRERDMLLTAGERVSMSLLTMALLKKDLPAMSLTGSQCGIITSTTHGEANIREIKATRLQDNLQRNTISVVAGFQGVSTTKEITTLGRGGSDFTAIALAERFSAQQTILFKDVPGIYATPPQLSDEKILLKNISWEEAFFLSLFGANVLHWKAAWHAWKNKVSFEVRSSLSKMDSSTVVGAVKSSQENLTAAIEFSNISIEQKQLIIENFNLKEKDILENEGAMLLKYGEVKCRQDELSSFTKGDWHCLMLEEYTNENISGVLSSLKATQTNA